MRVDTTFGIGDAWSLARHLSGSQPATVVLPTKPARKGAAAVLVLDQPQANVGARPVRRDVLNERR